MCYFVNKSNIISTKFLSVLKYFSIVYSEIYTILKQNIIFTNRRSIRDYIQFENSSVNKKFNKKFHQFYIFLFPDIDIK